MSRCGLPNSVPQISAQCHCNNKTKAVMLSMDFLSAAFCKSSKAASVAIASKAALLAVLQSNLAKWSCTPSEITIAKS